MRVSTEPQAAASMTGTKICILYSLSTTSITNITAANGVLKDAEIPAAMPQPASIRILL